DRVTIGKGTISFSKTGYITATGSVDFGNPAPPQQIPITINGSTTTKYLPPNKRFEEAIVQMFSATPGTGSTATITGRVTIENDVTNTSPEFPSNIVVRANLTNLLVAPGSFISSLQFADNSSLGVATVNNGVYTMTVPATAAGNDISLIIPNIDGTCRMAVNGYDNGTGVAVPLALPEYRDVPTSWGPQASGIGGTAIPSVAGARVILPAAPAQGSGLGFTFTPVGRSLATTSISSAGVTQGADGTFYKITNRGSYTGARPSVTITGGNGSGATATATLRTLVTSIAVTNRGSGYPVNVNFELWVSLSGGGSQLLGASNNVVCVGGLLPEEINMAALDGPLSFGSNQGFGTDDTPFILPDDATGVSVVINSGGVGSGGTINPTIVTDLASVNIVNVGSGYTSAPTFEFSGTGVNTPAAIQVVDFPVFWTFESTNGAGTDYPLVPGFTINYEASAEVDAATSANVQLVAPNGILDGAPVTLQSAMMVSSGDVVKRFPARTYRTTIASSTTPSIAIVNENPIDAKFTFAIGNIDATSGRITQLPTINSFGNGYNARMAATVAPTIAGAPGTGAALRLNYILTPGADFNDLSGEWTLNGLGGNLTITNQGSGYLRNLNQKGQEPADLTSDLAGVQAGKTYHLDLKYGTGIRKVLVN
ncbi:MAG TPA: hypothetical protein VGD65_07400, partial [Chryseosolibacter sp.]